MWKNDIKYNYNFLNMLSKSIAINGKKDVLSKLGRNFDSR